MDGIALTHHHRLIPAVLGRAADDDIANPVKNLGLLVARPPVEVFRQVPGHARHAASRVPDWCPSP